MATRGRGGGGGRGGRGGSGRGARSSTRSRHPSVAENLRTLRDSRDDSSFDPLLELGADGTDIINDDQDAPCLVCKKTGVDNMVQCVTCKSWACVACAGMSPEVYKYMSDNNNAIWFCTICSSGTLETLETGAQIQKKCKEIETKYDAKFVEFETKIETKADKSDVDNIKAEQITQKNDIQGLANDIAQLRDRIDLLRNEPNEKIKRGNNIVIRGIPENDQMSDTDIINKLLNDIGVTDIPIQNVSRLGKPTQSDSASGQGDTNGASQRPNDSVPPNAQDQQLDTSGGLESGAVQATAIKHRPIRFSVAENNQKWDILKKAPNVRKVTSDLFNSGKVWISPDQTKIERQDYLAVRNTLRSKRVQFPNEKFAIKNGKVVPVEERQPQPAPPQN